MSNPKRYDVVLWGATGATGRRAAHHLATRLSDGRLKWAIGGRNRRKLEDLRKRLPGEGADAGILVGDSRDRAFMAELAASTRVVLSTVGPFALYGSALVEACAAEGTHYCDLTGEVHWMRAMIEAHETTARESGARIVHACGHDSIPSDLGVQFLQEAANRRFGAPCKQVTTRVTKMRGGFSGGTAASFLNAMKLRETDPEFARLSVDPYALYPQGEAPGPDEPDTMMPVEVTWDSHLRAWTKPYFMAPMNAKVVRRSNALMGFPYGRDFRYAETAMTTGGIGGWWAAMSATLASRGFLIAMAIPATRRLLERHVLPQSGEGPPAELRETGYYELIQVGELADGTILEDRIVGKGDPAVESTTRMLVEAALCLAEDEDRIEVGGGFWTPASALGALLRERIIDHAGLTFEILPPEASRAGGRRAVEARESHA